MARIAIYNKKRSRVKRWKESPKCSVCKEDMVNIGTVNGVRHYECMVKDCKGSKIKHNEDGEPVGRYSRNKKESST